MSRLHRTALVLAALPMVLGGLVVLAWFATERAWLEMAGAVVIALGWTLMAIVPVLLLVAWLRARRAPAPRPNGRVVVLILGVLLLNVPACFGALWLVYQRMSRFTIELVNDGADAWRGLLVDGAGVQLRLSDVPAGTTTRVFLQVHQDGQIWLREPAPVMLSGYVTAGMAGSACVTRNADGSLEVRSSFER